MIEKAFLSSKIKELNDVIKNRNATITELNAYTVVLNDKIKELEDTVEFRGNIIRHVKECNKILEKEIKKEDAWISVKDRLPDDNDNVITLSKRNGRIRIDDFNYHSSRGFDCAFDAELITHWMPIPELPKEKKKVLYGLDWGYCIRLIDYDKFSSEDEINLKIAEKSIFYNLEDARSAAINRLTEQSVRNFNMMLESYEKLKQEEK